MARAETHEMPITGEDREAWQKGLEIIEKKTEPQGRIRALTNRLLNHKRAYEKGQPVLSDEMYDTLMNELEALERKHPQYALPNSPTKQGPMDNPFRVPTVPHQSPMLSLSNAFNVDEIRAFVRRFETATKGMRREDTGLYCDAKVDGIAVGLTYIRGHLERALTRGDGKHGQPITDLVVHCRNVVRHPPCGLTGHVRGELYMPRDAFRSFNENEIRHGRPGYTNPRAATLGLLLAYNSDKGVDTLRLGNLCFLAHSLDLEKTDPAQEYRYHNEAVARLDQNGFAVVPYARVVYSMPALLAYIRTHMALLSNQGPSSTMPCDGIVIKANSFAVQHKMGQTTRVPRYACAYKFSTHAVPAKVDYIEQTIGRTGRITPLVHVKPVAVPRDVSGDTVTVRKIGAGSFSVLEEMDIRINDTVMVSLRGGSVPRIMGVEKVLRPEYTEKFLTPSHCPACSSTLTREGRHPYCQNVSCDARLLRSVTDFARKNISGVGEATIRAFFTEGLVRTVADLYDLSADDIQRVPRIGKIRAEKIIRAIRYSAK